MMWILQILTNKKLRNSEKKLRAVYIRQNNELIEEIIELETIRKGLSENQIKDNPFLNILSDTNLKQIIQALKLINTVVNFLFLSAKRFRQVRKYTNEAKKLLRSLVYHSRTLNKDGFSSHASKSGIFELQKSFNYNLQTSLSSCNIV